MPTYEHVSSENVNLNELRKRVPYTLAMENIARYKETMSTLYIRNTEGQFVKYYTQANLLKGYEILHADIVQLLGVAGDMNFNHDHFRGYIGMSNDPTDPEGVYKFYMVPMITNQHENDSEIIPVGDVIIDDVIVPNTPFVYDFSAPCPNTCDQTSDLFKAGNSHIPNA